jgi:DNA modification methylase
MQQKILRICIPAKVHTHTKCVMCLLNILNNFEHETVKSEEQTRAMILTCSRPNDIVCVPFAGSGTECAMAAKEKRLFVGFETNLDHVMTARKRVADVLSQPTLF